MKKTIDRSTTKNSQINFKEAVMKGKLILIAICFILAGYGIANADYLLIDQGYEANVDSWHNLSYYKFYQEFTPSRSSMDMVRLAIHTNAEGTTLQIKIRKGSIDGLVVGTSETKVDPGFTGMARFMFASPIALDTRSPYIIEIEKTPVEAPALVASSFEEGGYPRGLVYIEDEENNILTDTSDVIFETGNVRSSVIKIESGGDALCNGTNSNVVIAILSDDVLDATQVDPESILFAEAGVKKSGKNGKPHCREEDSNYDGLPDLVCSIDVTQLAIEQGALSVDVTAETYDGMIIMGNEVLCGW